MHSKVLLIYTGGTIGMIKDSKTGALSAFDFKHLEDQIPELKRMEVEISVHSFAEPLDSSEINPSDWKHMAQVVIEQYENFDGFVILHGTDTMAFSASALSFMLQGISKPVIFTGSQLPVGVIRTDGRENLITTIEIAATKKADGTAKIQEVCVYFEHALYRGNRTSKISADDFKAFKSPNFPKLADVGIHIDYNDFTPKPKRELHFFTELDNRIALLKLFPGMNFSLYKDLFTFPEVKGIVIETFGSGNAPSNPIFTDLLRQFIAAGGIVLNITQCLSGSVEQGKYETSSLFNEFNVLSGFDLTTEAALTKMMFAFSFYRERSAILDFLSQDCCGEMSLD